MHVKEYDHHMRSKGTISHLEDIGKMNRLRSGPAGPTTLAVLVSLGIAYGLDNLALRARESAGASFEFGPAIFLGLVTPLLVSILLVWLSLLHFRSAAPRSPWPYVIFGLLGFLLFALPFLPVSAAAGSSSFNAILVRLAAIGFGSSSLLVSCYAIVLGHAGLFLRPRR